VNNASQSQIVSMGLAELGYRVVQTWANFVYWDVGEEASGIANRLRNEGVGVRALALWDAPNCIRVSIGTAEQNQFFLNAVRKIAGS
jgi:histidinol-phosphate aminotransferase